MYSGGGVKSRARRTSSSYSPSGSIGQPMLDFGRPVSTSSTSSQPTKRVGSPRGEPGAAAATKGRGRAGRGGGRNDQPPVVVDTEEVERSGDRAQVAVGDRVA